MRIEIAARLRPFSHTPGTRCLIPSTSCVVEVFPALLRFDNAHVFPLDIHGYVSDFTVEQDLEKGCVRVWGKGKSGYFRYLLIGTLEGIKMVYEKPTKEEKFLFPHPFTAFSQLQERLSLGMHRTLDWDLVKRRGDLREVLPVWLRLAALSPHTSSSSKREGTFLLLERCREAFQDKQAIVPTLRDLFYAGFSGVLVPRLRDEDFLGLIPDAPSGMALSLLTESAALIRGLFFREEGDQLFFLPYLPPEMASGRFIHLQTQAGDEISFEWSKKLLRQVIWRCGKSRTVGLHLQRALASFRLRTDLRSRGIRREGKEPLELHAGQTLYLDRFQK